MSLVSTGFLVFLLVGVIVYYLIPKKAQWAWLLILSYAYYLCSGYKTVVFILLTTIVTFTSGILLERTEDNLAKSLKAEGLAREDKKALKEKRPINDRDAQAYYDFLWYDLSGDIRFQSLITRKRKEPIFSLFI